MRAIRLVVLLGACSGCPPPPPPAVSVTIQTVSPSGASGSGQRAQSLPTFADVRSVAVAVSRGTEVVQTVGLALVGGTWSGTLTNLPAGVELTFTARAYGAPGPGGTLPELFSGVEAAVLGPGANTLSIAMQQVSPPESDYAWLEMTSLAAVPTSAAYPVRLAVGDTGPGPVLFAIDSGCGQFSPASGAIALDAAGLGSADVVFQAPAAPTTCTATVALENHAGNVSRFDAEIRVVEPDDGVVLGFSPVITRLAIQPVAEGLQFTVTAVDDGPSSQLSYSWSFDGSLAFAAPAANPALLAQWNAGARGTVRVVVTDADGHSDSATYALTGQPIEGPVTIILGVPPSDLVLEDSASYPGGSYRTILVKNGGRPRLAGDVRADSVVVLNGELTVIGNLGATDVSLPSSTLGGSNLLAVQGNLNVVQRMVIEAGSRLEAAGSWTGTSLTVRAGGTIRIAPASPSRADSGTLALRGFATILLEAGGLIDGRAAGADPRGQGGGYNGSGGGGHGGAGGRGYWLATVAGSAFGLSYDDAVAMGGAGGNLGGGALHLEGASVTLAGTLDMDGGGGNGAGGGAGGGVLIRAGRLDLTGSISARGGSGAGAATTGGGGGGGRVKVFSDEGPTAAEIGLRSDVAGGPAGGYLNTEPGGPGTVYSDAIPRAPGLVSPSDGAVVDAGGRPVFAFTVTDESVSRDGRDDDLGCEVQLSTDGFASVYATFDQNVSTLGWSELAYKSGQTATFTVPSPLPAGTYQWRARVRDRSVSSRFSEVRSLRVP